MNPNQGKHSTSHCVAVDVIEPDGTKKPAVMRMSGNMLGQLRDAMVKMEKRNKGKKRK